MFEFWDPRQYFLQHHFIYALVHTMGVEVSDRAYRTCASSVEHKYQLNISYFPSLFPWALAEISRALW